MSKKDRPRTYFIYFVLGAGAFMLGVLTHALFPVPPQKTVVAQSESNELSLSNWRGNWMSISPKPDQLSVWVTDENGRDLPVSSRLYKEDEKTAKIKIRYYHRSDNKRFPPSWSGQVAIDYAPTGDNNKAVFSKTDNDGDRTIIFGNAGELSPVKVEWDQGRQLLRLYHYAWPDSPVKLFFTIVPPRGAP